MLNSLAKLPHELAAGGPSAIIEVDPVLFSNENFEKMVSIIKSAIENDVSQMQFNVINAEMLIAAQEHPEKYQNLIVRVSGYNARFIDLGKFVQDSIIERTEHVLA